MNELKDMIPFNCIITGPTNCGKTQYIVEQLRGHYRQVFDYIVLICPTYAHNKTYRGFAKGDERFFVLSPFRENVACVVSFHNPSQTAMKMLFEEYGGDLDAETWKKLKKHLMNEKYARLCFSLRHPFQNYLEIPALTAQP